MTLDGFHRLRSSIRSEKLSQAANTATVPNQCAGRTSQSQTAKPGRWVFPASGTDWCSSASKQILEPICEAKFSNNSYGFRPNRSVEHAISRTYSLLQRAHLHYVLEFDIKGFFDNVNHSKLIRQLWALGIQDKQLLFVIKRILKAPIRMPDGSTVYPTKGTPQGGIISPLLAKRGAERT